MSLGVALVIGFAFFIFLNEITGSTNTAVDQKSEDQVNKDIERLRQIADYDRWENSDKR